MSSAVDAACKQSEAAASDPTLRADRSASGEAATTRRWRAVGDPQTTPRRFFTVLDREGMIDRDGWLRPDMGLVSIGDHFDFKGPLDEVERAGREVLSWLAAHPAAQVVVLAGNHDLSRVMELAFETDATFAAARALADAIEATPRPPPDEAAELRARFQATFRFIPSPGIARRDYSSFSEAQRALVQRLLLEGRFRLATTARVGGTAALLTHAGVTQRELTLLGLREDADSDTIAAALNTLLDRAVDAVRAAWASSEPAAISMAPVHVAGVSGREGGGLLYHRPARRDRTSAKKDTTWEFDLEAPRRFEPTTLPAGLIQVAGHSGHHRCFDELEGCVHASVTREPPIALRTLQLGASGPSYVAGVQTAGQKAALVLIDGGLAENPLDRVELLPLETA